MWKRLVVLVAMMALSPLSLSGAEAITVPGTSNPWLAGMPNGSTDGGMDEAPANSPVLVPSVNLDAGAVLTFSAAGLVSNGPCCPLVGPDGGAFASHAFADENGISDVSAPVNSLLGVFLDDSQPDASAVPGALNFATIGLDFASLSPLLKQVFFIGDGLTAEGSGTLQSFEIPTGATRLFLGTMDGFGWFNNLGAFEVTVTPQQTAVPEPATVILLLGGVAGLAAWRVAGDRRSPWRR